MAFPRTAATSSVLAALVLAAVVAGVRDAGGNSLAPDARLANTALALNGSDAYVTVPDHPSLDVTTSLTVAAWIYLESYREWASIVTKGGMPGRGTADLTPNNVAIVQSGPEGRSEPGRLRFVNDAPSLPAAPFLESATPIPLREWHFVAVTYDGSTVRFYLDGRLDGIGSQAGPLRANDEPLAIGADFPGGDEFWHGRIDELGLWTRALSESEVRTAMTGGSLSLRGELGGYWKLDEGSGQTAFDQSENDNDGRLVGGAAWASPGAPLPTPPPVTGRIRSASITQVSPSRLRARWVFEVAPRGQLTTFWLRNGRPVARTTRPPARTVDSFITAVGGRVPKGRWTAYLRVRGAGGTNVVVPRSRVTKVVR